MVACLFMVAIRTWVQYRSSKRLFSNDYLIFGALACHLAAVITCEMATPDMYDIEQLRLVVEAKQVPTPQLLAAAERFLTYQFILLMFLWSTLWLVKFSLLIFFWRMFESVRTKARAFWWIMIFVTAATFIITICLQLTACGSPQNFFKLSQSISSHGWGMLLTFAQVDVQHLTDSTLRTWFSSSQLAQTSQEMCLSF